MILYYEKPLLASIDWRYNELLLETMIIVHNENA